MLNVNGSVRTVTNVDSEVVIRFATQYSTNWHLPWYVPTLGTGELTAAAWHFVPLRKVFFAGGVIVPDVDNWHEPNTTRDNKATNFYFRVQL